MSSTIAVTASGHAKLAKNPISQGPEASGLRLKLVCALSVLIGNTDLSDDSQPPLKGVGYNKNTSDKKKGKKKTVKTRPDSLKLDVPDLVAKVKTTVEQLITKATRKEIKAFAEQELNKDPLTETCLPAMVLADFKALFPEGKLLTIQYKDAESDTIYPTVWRGDKSYFMIKNDDELSQISQLPFASKDDASVSVSVHCIELSVSIVLELSPDKKTLQASPEYDTAKLALTDRKPEVTDMLTKAGFSFGGASGGTSGGVSGGASGGASAASEGNGGFFFADDSESDAEDDDDQPPADASAMKTVEEANTEEVSSEAAPAAKKAKRGSKK